ncbi:MAG TPA: beta-propeller fold lactonase family protein [Longimicrobium sp.]|nr:beta-propeller fold lactonase family protein [Longimicrobium sp.]
MKYGWMIALALLPLAACDDVFGSDDDDESAGAVFTMNNAASANYVIVFARDDDGSLERTDSVATGGRGSGPHPVFGTDPLESQDAVILSDDNRLLFVVNAGSSEVTSFRVSETGELTRVSTVSSGGTFPVSLAVHGDVLYTVNALGGGNISGFRVAGDGTLTPLAGSTRSLGGAAMPGPGSIRISPNGRMLVVTLKATDRLALYGLNASGLPDLAEPFTGLLTGRTPFGADFDPSGHYILSFGNIGPNRAAVPDGSSVIALDIAAANSVAIHFPAVPTTETAACWVQITPDGRFAYTTNTGSGSITGFSISSIGRLTRLTENGQTGSTGAGSMPLDMAYADGYLYALTAGDRGIHAFRVGTDGSITAAGSVTGVLPISVTGLAAF